MLPYHIKFRVVDKYQYLGVEVAEKGGIDEYVNRIGLKMDETRRRLTALRRIGGGTVRRDLFRIYC